VRLLVLISYRQTMSALRRPADVSLKQRSPVGPRRVLRLPRRHRAAARVVAVAGPVVVALGLLPVRSSLGLPGVLFCTLLAVVAVALIGGVGAALTAVVVGFLAGALLFARPYGSLQPDSPVDVVALIAFVVVGGVIGILVDDLTRLGEEQAALRRVATLVARSAPAGEVFAAVTEEAGQLLPVDRTSLSRYESDGTVTVVATWSRDGGRVPVGTRTILGGKNLSTQVSQTSRPGRMDSYADTSGALGTIIRERGLRSAVATPVIVAGRLWGVMIAASMSERRLPSDLAARLADFTDIAATAVANAESRADLAASRARIVATADETRRRIERDLHDGAQQRLVSLALELRAAQAMLPPELGELEDELSRVAEGLTSVLDDLRETARGIHPAILAEGGLGPALKTLARRSPIPVELDVRLDARLPERIEVATYYIVSETLTNAAKHAHASIVHVGVEAVDGVIRVSVRDDGAGGADSARGSGLIGLRDRVEALGGAIEVESPLGAGTSVHVELPSAPS
jgi:signal transduction histidine kinase